MLALFIVHNGFACVCRNVVDLQRRQAALNDKIASPLPWNHHGPPKKWLHVPKRTCKSKFRMLTMLVLCVCKLGMVRLPGPIFTSTRRIFWNTFDKILIIESIVDLRILKIFLNLWSTFLTKKELDSPQNTLQHQSLALHQVCGKADLR